MTTMKRLLSILTLLMVAALHIQASTHNGKIGTRNILLQNDSTRLIAALDIVLDDVKLSKNHQLFLTPFIEAEDEERIYLPTVLVNGRNMHYVYLRSGLSKDIRARYNVGTEVRRINGTPQTISYTETISLPEWAKTKIATFNIEIDTCGCGNIGNVVLGAPLALAEMEPDMNTNAFVRYETAYVIPPVTQQPVSIHEGRARVQFEVDKTVLHTEPYICKSGQRIDNRAQLKVICDSIDYALSDPNVEIANINICGFASPESPYLHNEYLSTNRSRVLAEYIEQRYNLPRSVCTYSSVTENWGEFRELVVAATDITEQQRRDLLALIDKPTYGAADFDAKERTLKTDPRFAKLYREKILPVWFPQLRCTQFAISTRLKPASDEQLAEIIKKTPELLSLNQMFRVARLYQEGTEQFSQVFDIALRYYADDPVANLNAAVTALNMGNLDKAGQLIQKAGNSPEAENVRGILAAYRNDKAAALQHFNNAGNLREARINKEQIKTIK